jgi:phosphopantetheinyl transferase
MNPAEIAWFNHSPSQNKFLWIWTAKEVLYKLHSRLNPEISFQKELFIDIDQLSEITDQPSFSATGQFSRGDVLLQNSIEVFRWRHWWVCYAAST